MTRELCSILSVLQLACLCGLFSCAKESSDPVAVGSEELIDSIEQDQQKSISLGVISVFEGVGMESLTIELPDLAGRNIDYGDVEPPPTPGLRREGSRGDEKGNS